MAGDPAKQPISVTSATGTGDAQGLLLRYAPVRTLVPGRKIFHALPSTAGAVACYVVEQATAGKKVATLERALVSIRLAHQAADFEDPTSNRFVREATKTIRWRNSVSQKRAQPLLLEPLKEIVAELQPGRLKDARDRAILCLGFITRDAALGAGGARRRRPEVGEARLEDDDSAE